MSVKTYLQEQIRLVSLSSYDLFTDEEFDLYMNIIQQKNELDKMDEEGAEKNDRRSVIDKKNRLKSKLETLILSHADTPRTVRLKSIIYYPKDADYPFPEGVMYRNLKTSKKIAEFCGELSRAMGLSHLDCTLDLIVIKWKNIEILRQLITNGFYMPVLTRDGVENRFYRFYTASAGQLRRDKFMMIYDKTYERIKNRLECGLDWEEINRRGGCNSNKVSAYDALPNSATEEWTDFNIDEVVVAKDFIGEVTDRMIYIKPDYTWEKCVKTVEINHTDGCGMMLPEISMSNFMIRMPKTKGLLISFDFIKFCDVHGVEPIITDPWGTVHNLRKEGIKIILFESVVKMWKFYDNWDDFKKKYKENGCRCGKTNYEEDYIANKTLNYQYIQTLTDITDEEIAELTKKEHERIDGITKNMDSMLKTLKADEESEQPYKAALAVYPELLREAYSRESLRAIRKRMILDAKSGKLHCFNKRLFACPDLYAVCEHLFLNDPHPKGLLNNGEIACKIFRRHNKADVLRSPHLAMDHAIRTIVHDQKIYDWFYTNGIYTSCNDLITRILQMDVDGDQLNVVVEPLFVEIAERNIKKYDVVPLFYDAEKAPADMINNESMFNALKRAHDYSAGEITSIGEISNMLTRLWNKDNPDRDVANLLCMFNNWVIDAAKTGKINHYKNYPKVARRIGRATGGKNGRMPWFFQFSKNGRKDTPQNRKRKYDEPNNSTMNRICKSFDDIGNINMNYAGIPQFNWQMLLSGPCIGSKSDISQLFCELDNSNLSSVIESQENSYASEKQLINNYGIVAEDITREMIEHYGSLENAFPYISKYLFAGEGMNKSAHKQMYWRVFGHIALGNLRKNLMDYDVCPECGIKIPAWVKNHQCIKNTKGFYVCIDCGLMCERTNARQCRCEECQEKYRNTQRSIRERANRRKKKEASEQCIIRLQSSRNEI
ncbi:MAG: hypothetical protein J6Y78_15800 [Paludibacteraceae bacterium]|nr:hypothetical protein [Paludibacteraceae bacterium]